MTWCDGDDPAPPAACPGADRAATLAVTAAWPANRNIYSGATKKRWPPPGRSAIVPSWSWPASGSGGFAENLTIRWPT